MSEEYDEHGRRSGFDYFICTVVRETDKARLVKTILNGIAADYWVPKTLHSIRKAETGEDILEVRSWWASKNGIVGDEVD